MKEPIIFLVKPDLTQRDMQEVVMNTEEPYSTREATKRFVKILDSTYAKADLDEAAASAV